MLYCDKYKNIINDNKSPSWKKYECMVALQLNMIRWEDAVDDVVKKFNIPIKADYGIDLISPDFKKTAQVKHYNGSTITWRSVSTYISYSSKILGITDMLLVTTSSAKIQKIIKSSLPIMIIDNNSTLSDMGNLFAQYEKIIY